MSTVSCSYIRPLVLTIDRNSPLLWANSSQVASLHLGCPFVDQEEAEDAPTGNAEEDNIGRAQEYVVRAYLETLWLPDSLHPLPHLISNLQRVTPPVLDEESEHPLHTLLAPILLTTRTSSDKYNIDLAQILEDGGSAEEDCEMEESIMWYAWSLEKVHDERTSGGGAGSSTDTENVKESEAWRKTWLRKLEKRETMIQILLYLLALSLPGPFPLPPVDNEAIGTDPSPLSPSKHSPRSHTSPKKSKKSKREESPTRLRAKHKEDTLVMLESYMDKLAVWQLTEGVEGWLGGIGSGGVSSSLKGKGKAKDDRDWTQVFCEDVVEKMFKDVLPEQITLLRSKIFPTSPFDGSEESSNVAFDKKSRANSKATSRTGSTFADNESATTVSKSSTTSKRALSRTSSRASVTSKDAQGALKRSRSRSLSVTIARDEEEQRRNLVTGESKKRAFSRECSMKKTVTKTKADKKKNTIVSAMQRVVSSASQTSSTKRNQSQMSSGTTLVKETPVKRQRTLGVGDFAGPSNAISSQVEVVIIEDTPETTRIEDVVILDTPDREAMRAAHSKTQSRSQSGSRDEPKTPCHSRGSSRKQPHSRPTGHTGIPKSLATLLEEAEDDEDDEDANVSLTPKAFPRVRLASVAASQRRPRHQSGSRNRREPENIDEGADGDYDELVDESFTESFGSPDVLLLESSPMFGEGVNLHESTPTRKRPARKGI